MTVALAASIVECGQVDAAHAAATYADRYEPWRGYGAAPLRLCALKDGADYRGTGRPASFPTASLGLVAPMRIGRCGPGLSPGLGRQAFIGLSKTPCSARTCIPTPLTAPSSRPGPSHWQPAPICPSELAPKLICPRALLSCGRPSCRRNWKPLSRGLQHDDSDALAIAGGQRDRGLSGRCRGALGLSAVRADARGVHYPAPWVSAAIRIRSGLWREPWPARCTARHGFRPAGESTTLRDATKSLELARNDLPVSIFPVRSAATR